MPETPPFKIHYRFTFDDWRLAQTVRYKLGPLGRIRSWMWIALYFAVVLLSQAWLGSARGLALNTILDPVAIGVYLVVAAAFLPLLFWLANRFSAVNYKRFFGKDSEIAIVIDASGVASTLKGASNYLPWALFNARVIAPDAIHLQLSSADRAVMYLPRRGLDGSDWDGLARCVMEMTPGVRSLTLP
jgi:hypothetical protein